MKIGYALSLLEANTIRALATAAVGALGRTRTDLSATASLGEIALGREARAEREGVNLGASFVRTADADFKTHGYLPVTELPAWSKWSNGAYRGTAQKGVSHPSSLHSAKNARGIP